MEFVSLIAEKVVDYLFVAAGGQLGYLVHYNDNIENLKKQAKKLADSRDMVQQKIEFAERNGETIFATVQSWIAEADKISAETEKFLEDDKANKRCLKGWCINLKQRYRFSKEAKKHSLEISNRLQEMEKFESVSCPAPPAGIISSSKLFSSGTFESRNSIKKQIVKVLIDDHNVSIIGICGMGGVGKTTLVKEIGQQAKEEKIYDEVVMAVVSQTPSIMKIQGDIADMLGVTKSLPTNSELARARFLWDRIKEKKHILVILDDIWERIELNDIGIPLGNDHRGCKIVITSRSKTACTQMTCQKIFTVEVLSKQESWVLFREIVGSNVETTEINPIARDVAAKCDGLPIAIVTIARALKDKNTTVWRDALRQLKRSTPTNIPGTEKNIISSLELSFTYLESVEAKTLFLFCSLFPEDYKIRIEDLVRYGIGLRWFEDIDEKIEDIRDRIFGIVSTITSSFLLIDDGEKFVKMHDVIRDFALVIAPKYNHRFMTKAGLGLQEWSNRDTFENFTCISLMTNNIRELPKGLECPKLQALLLQENTNLVVPSCFFREIKDLKVLDLSQTKLWSLPESLSFLLTVRTLNLSGCNLGDLSVIGSLNKLEILSLSESSIQEIPVSFSQLNNLRLLDLNNCEELTLIPRGVIPSLKKLEELYINRFKQWESESENLKSNANLVELEALSRLTHLEISISNLDLSSKLYSRNMRVSQTNISKIHDWVKGLLKRTEYLVLEKIANLESISHNLVEEGFNELKYLDITSCDEIKYLLNTFEWTPNSTFYNLEELYMYSNPNLVELCHGQPPTPSFSKLKILRVWNCHNMLNVVPSLLQSLICLEEIDIDDCNNLEEIFEKKEALNEELDHTITSPSLGNLTTIQINDCDKLKNLFTPSIVKCLVKLKSLQIWGCSTIEEIVTNEKGEKEASIEKIVFPSLYYLDLYNLDNLTCFSFGSYTIEYPSLERLEIWKCGKMKTFGYGEQVTPKLNKVLPELHYRWNGNLNATVQEYFNEQGDGIVLSSAPPLPPPQSGRSFIDQISLFEGSKSEGVPLISVALPPCPSRSHVSLRWDQNSENVTGGDAGFDRGGTLWFQNLTEFPHGLLGAIFPIVIAALTPLMLRVILPPPSCVFIYLICNEFLFDSYAFLIVPLPFPPPLSRRSFIDQISLFRRGTNNRVSLISVVPGSLSIQYSENVNGGHPGFDCGSTNLEEEEDKKKKTKNFF
ncbi:probable disease resistance protein At4g27220 [Pistacia vera]|uniref:probable disease resistance protein At4g27220 n=1 Tax=Pistacia vera TaxID=55513 RepID=UPI0012634C6B|nr:probable disease resistance protein At4g27220 [Pistacia vera]